MELLTTLGIDWKRLIADIVNFVIVFLVLRHYAYRPILAMMAQRTKLIEDGVAAAAQSQEAKRTAELDGEEYRKAARQEASRIIAQAQQDAEALRLASTEKTKADVATIVRDGKEKLQQEKETMIADAQAELGQLVVAVVEKVLPNALTKEQHTALVTAAKKAAQQ